MMRRETAYKLAGRKHRGQGDAMQASCVRKLRLHEDSADRVAEAAAMLMELPGVRAEALAQGRVLLRYDLSQHCLRDLEQHVKAAGFRLDDSLFWRIYRSITHYCEDTRRHNNESPQRLTKKYDESYVKAYEQHAHGDHDDTPPELREYR